jgi:hypothetical protein
MSIFDRLRPSGARAGAGALAMPAVLAAAHEAVARFEHAEVDAALLRAQLADRCRDAGVEPVDPEVFDAAAGELDTEGWRRLAALAALWAAPEPGAALAAIVRERGSGPAVAALVSVARGKPLLTMAVLRMSALRIEELARAQLAALGIAIAGETAAQSAAALQRLDYERLLAQAEQARQAAEGRLAQLKQAQDEDDRARSPRRGKW